MAAARRITISLPEDVLRAADRAATSQGWTRSAVVEDGLKSREVSS